MAITVTRRATTKSGLSYLCGGRGSRVLFLHGVPGSALAWAPVLHRLPANTEALVPDLLGFGMSRTGADIAELGIVGQAAAVLAMLDEFGWSDVTVVTHDFGGPVALHMYSQRPDLFAGLVLSSTNAFPDTPIPMPLSAIFWPIVGPMAAAAIFSPLSLRLMLRTGSGNPDPMLNHATYVGDRRQARTIRTIFEHSLRNLADVYRPLEAVLRLIEVPTAVLWGDADPFFAVDHGRRTASAITGAAFSVLPGAGHFLPAERPGAYAAAIQTLRS
jgi:pimeloyl-ACP methyl ester carboxylesterase